MVAVVDGDGGENKKSEFIVDPKHRMEKWKCRSKSLMKQAWELSTLCHTPTCIVISPPIGTTLDSSCSKFGIWPENDGASLQRMIDLYNASPTQTVVRASKKVKVTHDVDDQTKRGSCGGGLGLGLPSILTASGDNNNNNNKNAKEEAGKKALQAVNNQMEQIQTRDDAEDNTRINAIVNADAASKEEKRDDADDTIDLWFLDFTDDNNATTTCDHQDDNNNSMDKQNVSNVADIHQGGAPTGKENEAQLTDSNSLNEYSCHYLIDLLQDEDESFQNIFEQQQIIVQDSYINTRNSF